MAEPISKRGVHPRVLRPLSWRCSRYLPTWSWGQVEKLKQVSICKRKKLESANWGKYLCDSLLLLFSPSVMSNSLLPPWAAACQASLSFTISWSLVKHMSMESVDATQPSHPLLSPSPPAFNLSQQQDLFQWISSLHQVVKVLEHQLQHQSFQWIFRTDFL